MKNNKYLQEICRTFVMAEKLINKKSFGAFDLQLMFGVDDNNNLSAEASYDDEVGAFGFVLITDSCPIFLTFVYIDGELELCDGYCIPETSEESLIVTLLISSAMLDPDYDLIEVDNSEWQK